MVRRRSPGRWRHYGDGLLATGMAVRLNNTWRTGGGIELHADTASNPALGDRARRLKPFWGIAHDVTNWLTLNFTAEYSHSIAEEGDVAPQRYLELSLPASFILPYDWSIGAKYKAQIDFANDDPLDSHNQHGRRQTPIKCSGDPERYVEKVTRRRSEEVSGKLYNGLLFRTVSLVEITLSRQRD